MLIIGGYSQNGPLSSVELLDIKSGRWEKLPDLPQPRYGHACLLMELAGKEGVLVNQAYLAASVARSALEFGFGLVKPST